MGEGLAAAPNSLHILELLLALPFLPEKNVVVTPWHYREWLCFSGICAFSDQGNIHSHPQDFSLWSLGIFLTSSRVRSGNYPRKIPLEIHISRGQTGKKNCPEPTSKALNWDRERRKQFLVSHPPCRTGHGQATHQEIFPRSSPWIIYQGLKC